MDTRLVSVYRHGKWSGTDFNNFWDNFESQYYK